MRRNLENTNGLAQANHREILLIKTSLAQLHSKIESLSIQVQKATFQSVMQTSDISEFFPVESNDQLEQFMDRNHPEWPSRRAEFYNFLLTVTSKVKKGFARGLIKALFSRTYILTVKWSNTG